jgi:uncharacterized protein YlzI (FlbEa/FlbD family)
MVSVETLKKEVSAIREELNIDAEDKTVIMRVNGKDYTSKNIGEGIQKLIEFSREMNLKCQQ